MTVTITVKFIICVSHWLTDIFLYGLEHPYFLSVDTVLHSIFYKNRFYKNVQAEINQNFKNILRTYPGRDSIKNVFILLIFGE